MWNLHSLTPEAYQQILLDLRTKADAWCVCRKSDDDTQLLMACSECQDWFHPGCVNINTSEIDVKSSDFVYTCSLCQRQQQVAQAAALPATITAIGPMTGPRAA